MIKMPNMSPWVLDQYGNPTNEYFSAPESSLQGNLPQPARACARIDPEDQVALRGRQFRRGVQSDSGTDRPGNRFLPAFGHPHQRLPAFVGDEREVVQPELQPGSRSPVQQGRHVRRRECQLRGEPRAAQYQATLRDQIEATNNNSYSITTTGSGAEAVSSPSSEGKIIKMNSAWAKRRTVGLVGSLNYVYDEALRPERRGPSERQLQYRPQQPLVGSASLRLGRLAYQQREVHEAGEVGRRTAAESQLG